MKCTLNRRCSGLSLVELLVALVVSLVLAIGTTSLYLLSKRAYMETEGFSWIQENARIASLLISEDLKLAMFYGEGTITPTEYELNPLTSDCTGYAAAHETGYPIAATVVSSSGTAFGCITDGVAGTNALVIKHVVPTPLSAGDEETTKTYVVANNEDGVIYDGADGTPDTTILPPNSNGTRTVWEYLVRVYYIRQASACSSYDEDKHTSTCLARKVLRWSDSNMTMVTEDVVDGVEAMQLNFGQDTDSDGEIDSITKASDTTDWDGEWQAVASVQFSLLLIGEKEDPTFDASARTYNIEDYPDVGDKSYTPTSGDHYRRSMIHSTVVLRNPNFLIRG